MARETPEVPLHLRVARDDREPPALLRRAVINNRGSFLARRARYIGVRANDRATPGSPGLPLFSGCTIAASVRGALGSRGTPGSQGALSGTDTIPRG